MINHVYTILRATPTYSLSAEYPGDVYVPPRYIPSILSRYMRQLRTVLFGVEADGLFTNYRVRQLLSILESTDLRDFLKYYDSRITYQLNKDTVPTTFFTPSVTGDTYAYNLLGEPAAPDVLGISHYRFTAEIANNDIIVSREGRYPTSTTQELVITAGSSQVIPADPTGYGINYVVPGPAQTQTQSPRIVVDIYLEPQKSLAELVNDLRQLPADVFPQLFGLTNAEPYATFRNCWYDSPELAYQLSGVVLAYVGRVTELQE